MKATKKQYSAAEKIKIALEAIKGELTTAQISSKYGVHATQISNWKQQAIHWVWMAQKKLSLDQSLEWFYI